uniref:Uncharacterized protein n=1 Tax=Hyaloperonospora arabidopsidis (strain Emoy2) TaxID=559515 RepID=M4BSL4_HYAAE
MTSVTLLTAVDENKGSEQHVSSMNAENNAAATSASGVPSIFSLYQEGLGPDQVLQLCFVRQRGPQPRRHDRTLIEHEFVLPQVELKIASLLPPIDISLENLVDVSSPSPQMCSNTNGTGTSLPATALDQVRASARSHFFDPRQASLQDVDQWAALTESDWIYVYQSLQQPKQKLDQDNEMIGVRATKVPDIVDVCWMLEHCHSDAFAAFVWDHLLIALLQQCLKSSDPSTYQRLFALLVRHHSLASLSPKDFRAKVRSRNLRQVDDLFGAKVELALIGHYRSQRA